MFNNLPYYQALQVIINDTNTKDDIREKARGFLKVMTKSVFLIEVEFLSAVCKLLKAFSLRFQSGKSLISDYINLQDLLKHILPKIDLDNVTPAIQYWFKNYLDLVSTVPFQYPSRSSRSQPSDEAGHLRLQQEIRDQFQASKNFLRSLKATVDSYWWDHYLWRGNSKEQLTAAGYVLNTVENSLGLTFIDPLLPVLGRCPVCNELVLLKGFAEHKQSTCSTATQLLPIESLGCDFLPTTAQDSHLTTTARLSFMESHCTPGALTVFLTNARAAQRDLERRRIAVSMQSVYKRIYTDRGMLATIPVGMQHMQLTLITMAVSEAICETLGSMMEHYHKTRFMNTGPLNNDDRLQRELYVKVNGPPLVHAGAFIRTITDKMIAGVPYHDNRQRGNAIMLRKFTKATKAYLEGGYRRQLVSKALLSKRDENTSSRKGILENF